MHKTNISWTNYASNPIRARRKSDGKKGWWCSHVSDGCSNCYAEVLNRRWGNQVDYKAQNADQIEFYLDEKELKSWDKLPAGAMCFVCDMTDLFHEGILDWMIARVFDAMEAHPRVIFQILTKRVDRMRMYLAARWKDKEPPGHIWPGASVENQKAANERIPLLLRTPAAIRFLSCEPLLGPIDLGSAHPCGYYCDESVGHVDHDFWTPQHNTDIKWVIVGGESGANFREMNLGDARSLRDQCQGAGTAFFYKQGSSRLPGRDTLLDGKEYHEWPAR